VINFHSHKFHTQQSVSLHFRVVFLSLEKHLFRRDVIRQTHELNFLTGEWIASVSMDGGCNEFIFREYPEAILCVYSGNTHYPEAILSRTLIASDIQVNAFIHLSSLATPLFVVILY
jgi:hypothetical protein